MEKLTFPGNRFDCILSFDVLEHVDNYMAAIKACYRCLKPDGFLLFSVPFSYGREKMGQRTQVMSDGTIEHLMKPEYHGNPIDPESGTLRHRYFAWDVLKDLKKAGFAEPKILHYWSRDYAYLGDGGFFILARKTKNLGTG